MKITEAYFNEKMRQLVVNQLNKRTGKDLFISPVEDYYQNKYGKFVAINCFDDSGMRLRFNSFLGENFTRIVSVDVWYKIKPVPDRTLQIDFQYNILQVIDELVSVILKQPIKEAILQERKTKEVAPSSEKKMFDPADKVRELIMLKQQGKDTDDQFKMLREKVRMLDLNIKKGLIVTGGSGLGKTETVRNTLNNAKMKFKYSKPNIASYGDLYKLLYTNNDGILFLDEVDKLIKKGSQFITLLKGATDMDGSRTLTYINKMDKDMAQKKYPMSFDYAGKLVLVANISLDKVDDALKSRCFTQEIDLSNNEVLARIEKTLRMNKRDVPYQVKKEVYDFLVEINEQISGLGKELKRLDFRVYSEALMYRMSKKRSWQRWVFELVAPKL